MLGLLRAFTVLLQLRNFVPTASLCPFVVTNAAKRVLSILVNANLYNNLSLTLLEIVRYVLLINVNQVVLIVISVVL